MLYVALLRAINVGGKNKIDMRALKASFEEAGMSSVRTYINSGNVIFTTRSRSAVRTARLLETSIQERFEFHVPVLLRDESQMSRIVASIPETWVTNQVLRCDVMFLGTEIDRPSIIDEVPRKPEIEDLIYTPGALVWRIDRGDVTRSGVARMVSSPIYKQLTIRNCNTARKLLELMTTT